MGGGGPIIGEAKSIAKGLMIATGHTCWVSPLCTIRRSAEDTHSRLTLQGICNAPGTARAITELVYEGRIRCADLRKMDPARFI